MAREEAEDAVDDRERQNLLLMANVCLRGSEACRVRVRNISSGGVKVLGPLVPYAGEAVRIELPNLGWLRGKVAWTSGEEFGIQLYSQIDPLVVRQPVTGGYARPDRPDLRRVA